ncbi:alpha/beta hydrolase [uncultured Megasphaera sp.]|uniref:alpha/beta hydrolase n=1 Tax=uncultured Megasphaera sp. TaxID=165188 RepID=UPI00265840E1|nr:alpha/beta hydrolase [uncultured Megasphaera sp.]
MLGKWIRRIGMVIAALMVIILGIGAYIGNLAYEEFTRTPWDSVLGIENHSADVAPAREMEQERGWEAVRIEAADGISLRGTYIEDSGPSHNTVILLHGLYQNRSMCLAYVPIYRNLGYNVLLIDQRGHGESGGTATEWGLKEVDDISRWVSWLKHRDPAMRVGLHGISLGAAMSLLYAGSDQGQDAAFVVADSSYGNIVDLGREKLRQVSKDERIIWGYNVLDIFFQGAMLWHTHKLLSHIEPAVAVRSVHSPVLFLHGADDALVPVRTAQSLYERCASPHKDIYIFANSPHAAGIESNRDEYRTAVRQFLQNLSHP